MLRRLQQRNADRTQPLWQRALVLACLLLVTLTSTAQAAHTHGKLLPNRHAELTTKADLSAPQGGEEHCPLCVAMHSAMVATQYATFVVTALTRTLPLPERYVDRVPESITHFASFSRPPPALETL